MTSRIGLIWGVVTTAIAALVGFFAYQAGWADGVATKLPSGTGAPYYYNGFHPVGFGFFGLIPLLLIIVVVVLLFRGFGRRPWGWGGPGYRGYGGQAGHGDPPPWVDERLREWHQRAHSEGRPAETPPTPGEKPGSPS